MACMLGERMRLKRQRDRGEPDQKCRRLDTTYMFENVDVTIIMDEYENVWFKAVDLARAMEMKDPNESAYQLIDKENCQNYENLSSSSRNSPNTSSMQPKTTFVNETGMMSFISKSFKPKAESFKEWVRNVVLPSIHNTHECEVDPVPNTEMTEMWKKQLEDLRVRYANLEEKNANLEEKNANLEEKNANLEEKNTNLEVEKLTLEMKMKCVEDENSSLVDENTSLVDENTSLKNEKSSLVYENTVLKNQKSSLVDENTNLDNEKSSLKNENRSLKNENSSLMYENTSLKSEISILAYENTCLLDKNLSLFDDLHKYAQQVAEMKPFCVPPLKNKSKQEYLVLYRKYKPYNMPLDEKMPYYACRRQLGSVEQRRLELLEEYPELDTLLELPVPNSVVFFNYLLEKMPKFLKRESRGQSFCIKDISENEMLKMVENIHQNLHGSFQKK